MHVHSATSRVIRTFPRDDLAYVAWLSSLAEQKKRCSYNKSVSTQIMGRNMAVSERNIKSLTLRFCARYTGTHESFFRDLICMEMHGILLCGAILLTLATYPFLFLNSLPDG